MANMFERLAALGRQTVERVHGEAVTIYPTVNVDVNAEPTVSLVDAGRWETVACFFENTMIESERRSQPSADGRRIMQRSLQRQASIRIVEDKAFKTGFFMRRHDDDAWFVISSFDPDGVGQVMAVVATAKPTIV